MRIETYTKKLTGYEYKVIGGDMNWEARDYCKCPPIKMSLFCYPDCTEPLYNNLDELIQLADSDCFTDPRICPGFKKKYAEIMRGHCHNWQLSAFGIFVGGIQLYYGNPRTGEEGFLWIIGAERLALTFQTQRSILGFTPTYSVLIKHENGDHKGTIMEEDFGYVRYKKEFLLIDQKKKDDDIFHKGNQYLRVTEYTGM